MTTETSLLIVGTGDHAGVALDAARASGLRPLGFIATDQTSPPTVFDMPVLGSLDEPMEWIAGKTANFIVAVGDNRARAAAFDRCLELRLKPKAVVHPSAHLLGGAVVEPGALICAAAVIGVNARVCANAIVNTSASVDHDNLIGIHATVGPGAHLAGRVTVDEGAYVGIGAAVRQGITIGSWSLVGAGSVVVKPVNSASRVAGVPARPMKGRTS